MTPPHPSQQGPLALMSALADGQRDACDAALDAWSSDPQARAAWHQVQLMGDVMRSDELATAAAHDEAFLARLRLSLDAEPIIFAPASALPAGEVPVVATATAGARVAVARPAPRVWAYAVAAAGFMAVGAVVMSLNRGGLGEARPSLAVQAPTAGQAQAARAVVSAPPQFVQIGALPQSALVSTVSVPQPMLVNPGTKLTQSSPLALGVDPQWRAPEN